MRGKHEPVLIGYTLARITPACAGKTLEDTDYDDVTKDHPRVCGENKNQEDRGKWLIGSPPRVRGKHHARANDIAAARITPACAGKTCRI